MPESQEKQAILFLPGLLNDGRLFSAQMAALTQKGADCRAITLDMADNMRDIGQKVLEQAPNGPFSLVALSMGGYAAFEVIRQLQAQGQGGRLQKLALMNTSARADSDEQRKKREGLIELSLMGRFKGVTPRLLPQLLAPTGLANEAITGLILQMAEDMGREGFITQQRAILSRVDSRALLPTITQPALVIGGTEDKLTPPKVVEEIASLLPKNTLHMFDDCGHLSPLEKSDAVTDLLVNFFA